MTRSFLFLGCFAVAAVVELFASLAVVAEEAVDETVSCETKKILGIWSTLEIMQYL